MMYSNMIKTYWNEIIDIVKVFILTYERNTEENKKENKSLC